MSDSIWKKEISFGRKPKEEAQQTDEVAAAAPDSAGAEPKQSFWKKEIGKPKLPKEPKAAKPPKEPGEQKQSIWKKEIGRPKKAAADPVELLAAAAAQAMSPDFPGAVPEPVAAPTQLAEAVVAAAAVEVQPEPLPAPADIHPVDVLPVAPPLVAPPPIASLIPVAPVAAVAADPPPPVQIPAPPLLEPAPVEAWMEPVPVAPVEPWLAEPVLPPEPEAETAVVLHPPVAAAELPPLPAGPKQPFWKRELSLSRKPKPAAEAATPSAPAGVHPPVPAAELPPVGAAKQPFWKKELGKPKTPKAAKTPKAPKTPKAEQTEKTSRAKRELSLPRLSLPALPSLSRSGGKNGHHQVKRLVGLKVGGSQLAAARISNNGVAELTHVVRADLAPGIVVAGELRDPDSLSEALKAFFAANKLPKKNVRLGIASNRIGVRTFEISGIEDQKQLENAIHFRAQEALPIPLDEAVLDYHILEERVDAEGNSTKRVLLVVAYRELVERYVVACRKAGITLAGIDLEAFALLRALSAPRPVGEVADAALVAVAIGHDRSTFAVSNGRVCEFTRVLEWGGASINVAIARALDLAPSEAEGIKRAVSLTSPDAPEGLTPEQYAVAVDAVRKQVQGFARELVSSLQFYQNQPESLGIGEIVITGGTANLAGLAEELQKLIGVTVRVGDPLARLKVGNKVRVGAPVGSLAVAIGLGIED